MAEPIETGAVGHAIWIGGPPGSGKTTVASRIARRHGLRLYSADTRTWIHRERLAARGSAAAQAWDIRAIELNRERGPLLVEDVAALPEAPLVVAEGTPVPKGVSPAVWLIPTRDWQHAQLGARGTAREVIELYVTLRDLIVEEAGDVLVVDGARSIDETVDACEQHFRDELARNVPGDRRALMREANLAIVGQIRTAVSRPWHSGDPEAVERDFYCECGDPSCTAIVRTTVATAAAAPVLR